MKRNYTAQETPAIFGADNGRTVVGIESLDDLKSMGAQFDGNSAMLNDEWSFADMNTLFANNWIKRQATVAGGTRYTTLVCGERTRNGSTRLAWFNLGSLTRQDVNREPVMPEWYNMGNDYTRIEHLAGRTFKVVKTETHKMAKWEDGVRVEGAFDEKAIPVVPVK